MQTDLIPFAGAAEHARMLAAGAISAPALLELYLERIGRLDPALNAYRVVLADTARSEAAAAQQQLDDGRRLPLLGVPIAIKDNVDVAGTTTTFGSSAYGPTKDQDAEVVRRLRAAGAVILGKTAVSELCIWPFTETVEFGATRNPWDTSRTPGGSSGGSGAAMAAGLASLALGSDGGGSIRIPATWCGVFGIKPQRDRVPLSPHVDSWYGLDVNGPLTRTVEDAALFLDVTAEGPGPEGGFVATAAQSPGRLRIAVSTKAPPPVMARLGAAQRAAVADAGALMAELGHQVVQRDPDYPAAATLVSFMPRYLRGIRDDATMLARPERLERRTKTMARLGALISDRRIAAVREREPGIAARVVSIFDDVDVVITPGTAARPFRIGAFARRGAIATLRGIGPRVPFQEIFNVTGQPAAVVPWGLDPDGLPVSVQIVGRPFDEATLLQLSTQIQEARPWAARRPPVS